LNRELGRLFFPAAVAAAVMLVATGCGSGGATSFADESVKEIVQGVRDDMAGLTSLRLVGDLTNDGQQIHLDMRSTTDGECEGVVKIGDGSAQVVSSGVDYWMKPDDAFWEQQSPDQADVIKQAIGDKWVSVPSSSGLSKACDLDALFESFRTASFDEPSAPPTKSGVSSVDGQDAVQITTEDEGGQEVTAWVATDDPHYILKIEVAGDTDLSLAFSEFDEPLDIQTPDPSEVARLDSLGG
jgi:hypothetical protein